MSTSSPSRARSRIRRRTSVRTTSGTTAGPVLAAGTALALLAPLAGCSAGDPVVVGYARPADTVVPSGTGDPRAQPAIQAYRSFVTATAAAQMEPPAAGRPFPAAADLTRYSFDPVRAEYEGFVAGLQTAHLAFRGRPPKPRVSVQVVDPDAIPYPRVVLTDCRPLSSPDWQAYDTRNDAAHPESTPGLPAPDGVDVTVVFYRQHWGVQSLVPHRDGSCSGD